MTQTTTKKKSAVRKFVRPDFINAPLPILFSCRVRLNQEERNKLKAAYEAAAKGEVPLTKPAIGNSTVKTETSYGSCPELEQALGMSRMIAYDQINTRDTIPLPVVLKFQEVLKVEIFTPERLKEAFDNYIAYLFAE